MYFIIFLFVLAHVGAYRESERLVERGSWKDWMFWIVFWKDDFWKIKNTKSMKFMNGLRWLLVFAFIVLEVIWVYLTGDLLIEVWFLLLGRQWFLVALSVILNIMIYWQTYMWFRNIGMLVTFRKNKFREWKYILPVPNIIKQEGV